MVDIRLHCSLIVMKWTKNDFQFFNNNTSNYWIITSKFMSRSRSTFTLKVCVSGFFFEKLIELCYYFIFTWRRVTWIAHSVCIPHFRFQKTKHEILNLNMKNVKEENIVPVSMFDLFFFQFFASPNNTHWIRLWNIQKLNKNDNFFLSITGLSPLQ